MRSTMTNNDNNHDEDYAKLLDSVIRQIVDAERANYQNNRERYRGIPAEIRNIIDDRVSGMPDET